MERTTDIYTDTRLADDHAVPANSNNPAEPFPFLLTEDAPGESLAARQDPGALAALPSRAQRSFDLALASAMLLAFLPLMLFCAISVRLSSRGPILFRHQRIGRGGRSFECLKFRTMVNGADRIIDEVLEADCRSRVEWAVSHKLSSDPRVTRPGQFMRRYCLDELPQLFNVLKGEMSLVGPRPIVADEVRRYGPQFDRYCSVNPGLTGLWQVSGLHALPYSERVRLDAEYAARKSVRLDMVILWRTLPILLLGQNQ